MASVSNSRIASINSGNFPTDVLRNAAPARLYQDAVMYDEAQITSSGGLATTSGEKTGRSPGDKRVVDQESVHDDVWWGDVNIALSDSSYDAVRQRAVDFLDEADHLYVLDAFAGWDPGTQIKVRIVCSRAYHAPVSYTHLTLPTICSV